MLFFLLEFVSDISPASFLCFFSSKSLCWKAVLVCGSVSKRRTEFALSGVQAHLCGEGKMVTSGAYVAKTMKEGE